MSTAEVKVAIPSGKLWMPMASAEGGHVALDHKEQVQGHIHHAGNAQIQQRPLCVPGGTEDTIAEVVYRHGRHTQSVDPQIPHGAGQQVLLGIQQ